MSSVPQQHSFCHVRFLCVLIEHSEWVRVRHWSEKVTHRVYPLDTLAADKHDIILAASYALTPSVSYAAPAPIVEYITPALSCTGFKACVDCCTPAVSYAAPASSSWSILPATRAAFMEHSTPTVSYIAFAPFVDYVTPAAWPCGQSDTTWHLSQDTVG